MNQNDSPNPAETGGEMPAPENSTALVALNPKPEVNADAKPEVIAGAKSEHKVDAVVPDPFAVGVRVLRMAPAWLLSMTAACSLLIVLLGWMNPGGMANAVAYAPATNPATNDARPAAPVAQKTAPAKPAQPANSPENAASAPESAPAPSPEQAAAAPAPEAPAQVQPTTPQPEETARPEPPAPSDDAAGKFTVQVGSFNNPSEANERVSGLRNAGFESRAVAVELPGRGLWYRVHVGRFADRAEAAKTLASLRAKGAAGMVVPVQD